MIVSVKPFNHLVALVALCGCGGSVTASSDEDGSTKPPDAQTDGIVDSGSPSDGTLILNDWAMFYPDVGPPPTPDSSTLDVDSSSFPFCSPQNCPNGCCNGAGQCIDPPTSQECGWFGDVCTSCGAATCNGKAGCYSAQFTCNQSNCGGCCIGMTSPTDAAAAMCVPGTTPLGCGFGGAECTACGTGAWCRPLGFDAGGFCQANDTCDPSNCTGCCVGNVCAQGNQANACGVSGAACIDCGSDYSCWQGICVCGGPGQMPCPDGG
jgi:hypothetical protein